ARIRAVHAPDPGHNSGVCEPAHEASSSRARFDIGKPASRLNVYSTHFTLCSSGRAVRCCKRNGVDALASEGEIDKTKPRGNHAFQPHWVDGCRTRLRFP